jgi:hypothetical protein
MHILVGRVRTFASSLPVFLRRTVQVVLRRPSALALEGRFVRLPVESVRLILEERVCLRLQHSALFFLWSFPHQPLDAAALVAALSVAS